jgi:hypothetical protein
MYIWSSAPIFVSARTNERHHHQIVARQLNKQLEPKRVAFRGTDAKDITHINFVVVADTDLC